MTGLVEQEPAARRAFDALARGVDVQRHLGLERARLALALGEKDEARGSLTAAIQGGERDPALITAWVELVAARPGEAIGVIEAAAEAAPGDVGLNTALARLAWEAGDARAAQIALWRLEEPPEEPTALVTRWLSRPGRRPRR